MTTYHLRDASGTWAVTLHSPDARPTGEDHGSEAICMINDTTTVLVRTAGGRLNTPAGHAEPGESSEETMIREVLEEAQADVTAYRLIGYARSEAIEGPEKGKVLVRDMYVARVALREWAGPNDEIVERLVIPLDDLVLVMGADWPGLDAFTLRLMTLTREALVTI